ncbi:hypothetical protein [Bradyrhizobium sp. USDA 10063]
MYSVLEVVDERAERFCALPFVRRNGIAVEPDELWRAWLGVDARAALPSGPVSLRRSVSELFDWSIDSFQPHSHYGMSSMCRMVMLPLNSRLKSGQPVKGCIDGLSHLCVPGIGPGMIPRRIQSLERLAASIGRSLLFSTCRGAGSFVCIASVARDKPLVSRNCSCGQYLDRAERLG